MRAIDTVHALPFIAGEGATVTQRNVEIVVGWLVTDERLRAQFVSDAEGTLRQLGHLGFELTPVELVALTHTDRLLWQQTAARLDSRLRRTSDHTPLTQQKASPHHV